MRTLLLCTALALTVQTGVAQDTPVDREKIVSAARSLMKTSRYCTLVTIGADGHPQARVVEPFEPDADMTVWIGTSLLTRKVAEIRADARVTLSYVEPSGSGYVTVIGTAELVVDDAEREAHFKPGWDAFYPSGPSGDQYVLIRVTPIRMEVLSYADGLAGDPVTWTPPSVSFR